MCSFSCMKALEEILPNLAISKHSLFGNKSAIRKCLTLFLYYFWNIFSAFNSYLKCPQAFKIF